MRQLSRQTAVLAPMTCGLVTITASEGTQRKSLVVGNLLVQLDHLRWMIRSSVLGKLPAEIPAL